MELVLTLTETITQRLENERVVKIPASVEEYFDLLNESENQAYKIQYYQEEIIATMGQASEMHEIIVANVISALVNAYLEKEDYRVVGSNRIVYSTELAQAFNPDAMVIKGETQLFPRKKMMSAMTNPHLIVEVHSDSTDDIDMYIKLPCYKSFASVQQIIYVHQKQAYISVYTRTSEAGHWRNDDYNSLDMSVKIDGFEIPMGDIYRKVVFKKHSNKTN